MRKLCIFTVITVMAASSCYNRVENKENKTTVEEITEVLSAEQISAMTPGQIIEDLLEGNARFIANRELERNGVAQVKLSAESGQHPQAIILSCIDSRVPVELLFDKGVGDIFVTRVAGNVVSGDILGSLEYACGHSTAKVVVVLGHTDCGAVHAAVSGEQGGNMTEMLARIHPAIEQCKASGAEGKQLEAAVVEQNVHNMMDLIRTQSEELKHLEKEGKIKIVGAIFDLSSGKISLL